MLLNFARTKARAREKARAGIVVGLVLLEPGQAVLSQRGRQPPQEAPAAAAEADLHPLLQQGRQDGRGQGDVPQDHHLAHPDQGHPDFLFRPPLLLVLRDVDDQAIGFAGDLRSVFGQVEGAHVKNPW
jgi:hypothetical protein